MCEEEVSGGGARSLLQPAAESLFVIVNVSGCAGLTLMRCLCLGGQRAARQHGGAGETDREDVQGKLNPARAALFWGVFSAHE